MPIAQIDKTISRKPLRLWPGVVAAVLLILFRYGLPVVAPDTQLFGMDTQILGVMGGMLFALAIIVWWVFFSRARWSERLGAIVLMIVAMVAMRPLTHESIQNGMMGMMFFVYAIPVLTVALVVWAVAAGRLSDGPRRAAMVAAILLACGVFMLIRTDGIIGGASDLAWRWTATAEERLLAEASDEPMALVAATTDQFTELARFTAIEGKTWNHPVLVGDVLLVRNGQEMVAFRLSLADS